MSLRDFHVRSLCTLYRLPLHRSLCAWAVVLAMFAFLIVCAHTPIEIHADASYDDALYMALGRHIADGDWLGSYDQYTLIKGVGYPLFLAVNAWLRLPVSLSHAIFQCAAVGIFFWVFARLSSMPSLAACGFVITLWTPSPYLLRLARNAIYPGQTLLLFAALIYTLCADLSKKKRITWALLTGLLGGWFSLTREEGIWVAPGVAIIFFYATHGAWSRRTLTKDIMIPLVTMALTFMVTQGGVSYMNEIAYGTYTRVEINSSPYKNALAALESVEVGQRIPYVPVSHQARLAIYEVSPAFRSLESYFDGPNLTRWQWGCPYYPTSCGDIAGGWFLWALRDAVATNGHYSSPTAAAKFYRELTDEIKGACSDGRLKCSTTLFALLPHISRSQWALLPESLLSGVKKISFTELPDIDAGASSGYPYVMIPDEVFLGHPVRTPGQQDTHVYQVMGWYNSSSNDWITGQSTPTNEQPLDIPIRRLDSPDLAVVTKNPDALHQRFDFNVTCGAPCEFKFFDRQGEFVAFDFDRLNAVSGSYSLGSAILHIDAVTKHTEVPQDSDARVNFSRTLRSIGANIFAWLMPWFAAMGLAAMLVVVCISMFARRIGVIGMMAAATWALIASRLLLLGIVDISSFPAMNPNYLSPAYALLSVAPTLSFGALFIAIRNLRGRSSATMKY